MIITGRRNTYVNYNIDTVHLQADYNSDTLHLQGALIHKGLYISYYSPFTFYRYIFFLQYNTIHYITGRLIHTAIYTGTTYIFFTIQIHYITLQDALIHTLLYISHTHIRDILSFLLI